MGIKFSWFEYCAIAPEATIALVGYSRLTDSK